MGGRNIGKQKEGNIPGEKRVEDTERARQRVRHITGKRYRE
jgi:hypothetical protein